MSSSLSQAAGTIGKESALTLRSVLLGSIMCVVIGVAGPYWEHVLHSSGLFSDYSVPGAMFMLFVLVLLFNGIAGRLWRPIALSPGELVVVTAMMLVSGAIITMGLVAYLLPTMAAPYYLADDVNNWRAKLWQHLPEWAAPFDEGGGIETMMQFYYGVRKGNPIPWQPWVKPLLWWSIFVMALYGCMISVMTFMRKQWVDYERLTFPVAQVPQELCATAAAPWARGSILRSKLFWFGFAVPSVACSMTALHKFYDFVPDPGVYRTVADFQGLRAFLYLSYVVIGFTFLIPNQVAFSLWALNLLSLAFRYVMKVYALESPANLGIYGVQLAPTMAFQGMGAMIAFLVASLYFSRQHLKKAFQCVIGRGGDYDRGEPSSYRTAAIMLVTSFVVMQVWLCYAGMQPLIAFALIASAILIFYGVVRVVAQCGVSVTIAPMVAPIFVGQALGSTSFDGRTIGALAQSWAWNSDIRTSVMSSAAHGMYLWGRRGRSLVWLLMLAALITYVTATVCTLWMGYRYGAVNLGTWYTIDGPKYQFDWAMGDLYSPRPPSGVAYAWGAVGAAITIGLFLAHRALFWWPLHPVAFLICAVVWTDCLVLSIFLGWLSKLIIAKVGGNRVLRKARLFFLGMILGQFTIAGIWAIFDTITHTMNHSVFYL